MKKPKRVYLDYAASAPLDKKVLGAMMLYLTKAYGNPSSMHSFGQEARAAIEKAREQAAQFLHCKAMEVIFTGGATEANNLVINGILGVCSTSLPSGMKPHVVISAIEHESVLAPVERLAKEGKGEITLIKPGKDGVIKAKDVAKVLRENTVLVSVMYANSEIGTVQPIKEIADGIRNQESVFGHRIFFHTDAAQAANYVDCNVRELGVDLLTLSSHKMYGPKGVGALYIRAGVSLCPLILGGGQEFNLRSGTEYVAGIAGFGAAISQIDRARNDRIAKLRDWLWREIQQTIPDVILTGSQEKRLPNNIHVRFQGVEGRDVVMRLDRAGFAVSTGSACSEKTQEPSRMLLCLGIKPKDALSSLRITLGRYTKERDIERFAKELAEHVAVLRKKGL